MYLKSQPLENLLKSLFQQFNQNNREATIKALYYW